MPTQSEHFQLLRKVEAAQERKAQAIRDKIVADAKKLAAKNKKMMAKQQPEESEEKVVIHKDYRPSIVTRRKFVYAFDIQESKFVVAEVIDMLFHSECCIYQVRTIKGAKKREFWTYRILKRLPPIK